MSSGLGEDWERILEDLRVIAPIYERGNLVLSFGRSPKLRKAAVSSGLPASGLFLDVGCGPGSMSMEAKRLNPSLEAVLLDPLPEMLSYASEQEELVGAHFVCGVYEYLPFRGGTFDAYLAGFTLRDARDRGNAIKEARRVLCDDGAAVVLDLGRPDSSAKRAMIAAYWRLLVPALLWLYLGERGRPFRDIYLTVRKLPSNSQMLSMFGGSFEEVRAEKFLFDGVLMITASGHLQAVEAGRVSATGLK
ncbi:MAG TPA: class I SAM-dependent methyltransferase [Conexivisphaerales archaeon]|nr:class I SAM-dependent methyltransferase [Conexivisphaerales archaeon]